MNKLTKHKNCLVCNSTNLYPLKDYYEQHEMIKCADCSFVFMERIPSAETLTAHYHTYAYGGQATLSPATATSYQNLLNEFEAYRKEGRILDVGCGRGWFLQEAQKRGWEVYGTEYSSVAIELCRKKGIHMKEGVLEKSMFEEGYFDVVTCFEVIEHINNPHEDLPVMAHFLRKGGLFYCTTPNFNSILRRYLKTDSHIIHYPEHLCYYTKKTLNQVVQKHGLQPKKFLSTGISLSAIQRARAKQKNTNTSPSTTSIKKNVSTDENLRLNIEKKSYLQWAKAVTNQFLTWTNLGDTLKGYYEKK